MQSIGFHDILLFTLLLILLLLSLDLSQSNPDVQFLSRGQSFVRYAGQSVEMDCEFYAVALDMFQHHIIWYKSQRLQQQQQYTTEEGGWIGGGGEGEGEGEEGRTREGGKQWGTRGWTEEGGRSARGWVDGQRDRRRGGSGKGGGAWEGERWVKEDEEEEDARSDGADRMQVNLMGSLLEPFASSGRYRVSLSQQPPTYRLRLLLTDLTAADTGTFSCYIQSVNDAEATTSITHALHVRVPVDTIRLTDDHSTIFNLSNFFEASFGEDGGHPTARGTIRVTDGRLNTVGCVVIGGYPPPAVDIYDGQREVTKQFALMRVFRYEGPRGLRTLRYVSARWSQKFEATEEDNGKVMKCEATVDGLTPYTASSKLNVHFVPVLSCRGMLALVGERNVFVSCQVRSNPHVSKVVWTFEDNGTLITSSSDTANDQYWTVVKTQLADFRLEVRLYIRQVRREHFRCYKVSTENSLGRTSATVQLLQRSRPVDRTTNPISFDARIKARKDEVAQTVRRSQPPLHNLLHVDSSSNGALQTKESPPFPVVLLLASLTTLLQTWHSV